MSDSFVEPLYNAVWVVLAGGAGERMGGNKPTQTLNGTSLLDQVIARIEPQGGTIAISSNAPIGQWPILPDSSATRQGPMAGLLSGLRWAQEHGFSQVLCVPCDTPFLPNDLAARLKAALAGADVAVACSGGERHPSVALWRSSLATQVETRLASGQRSLHGLLDTLSCVEVHWTNQPVDPFFNVNTPLDLLVAEAVLRSGSMPVVLDVRGLKCPLPAIKTEKRLAQMESGQILVVSCTDMMAQIDIPHMVAKRGDTLIRKQKTAENLLFEIERH